MLVKNSPRTTKILDAAAQLFARQGYHATTTREIAELAAVSENTLFRHFKDKEDIFCSALRSSASSLRQRWQLLRELKAGESIDFALREFLNELADTANHRPETFRLFAVAILELQGKVENLCRDLVSQLLSEITQYLAMGVTRGEVLDVDPELLAASLMSMILIQPQLSSLIHPDSRSESGGADSANRHSNFWLLVLSPRLPIPEASSMSTAG